MILGLRRPSCRLPRAGMIIAVAISAPDNNERACRKPVLQSAAIGSMHRSDQGPCRPLSRRGFAPRAGADIATDPGLWGDVTKDPYLRCAARASWPMPELSPR